MTQIASQIQLLAESNLSPSVKSLSRHAQRRLLITALVISDYLMLSLAFSLAYWLRFASGLPFYVDVEPSQSYYRQVAFLLVGLWMAILFFFRAYDWDNLLGGIKEYSILANASAVGTVIVAATHFIWPEFVIARGWLLWAWVITFLLLAVARFALRRIVYTLRCRGYFVVPALILGANDEARALAQQLASWPTAGLNILGCVGPKVAPGEQVAKGLYTLGNLDALDELVERYDVEELIVASSALTAEQQLEIFRRYGIRNDVHLRLSSGLFDIITTGLYVKSLGYVPLISVSKARLTRGEAFVKACLDYIGAAFGLVVLAPLFAAIAIAIKLDSPGPVIYRRRVLGVGGKPFDAFKFRTMYIDGDEMLTPQQMAELQTHHKLKDDPRITRVGRVLRKYSLDELPQLVNVLLGQMSLIGPRMITPPEKVKYGKWDLNLLTVKPGLSGLWQVSGRSDVGYEERVHMDMHYIRNYTIWLDLQLILRTILAVVQGKGAY